LKILCDGITKRTVMEYWVVEKYPDMVFSELIPCDGIASSYLKQTSEYPVVVF
jgi:hypothetical protein